MGPYSLTRETRSNKIRAVKLTNTVKAVAIAVRLTLGCNIIFQRGKVAGY